MNHTEQNKILGVAIIFRSLSQNISLSWDSHTHNKHLVPEKYVSHKEQKLNCSTGTLQLLQKIIKI